MTVATRIQELREAANLSRFDLAQAAGVRENLIYVWETDRRQPSDLDALHRIAVALGTTTDYLIAGDEAAVNA
jgi:transcriptional regulator with XRE-family HTH domain